MKKIQRLLLVALTIGFVTTSFSQRKNYKITNAIGVFGGVTKFDITTDNFVTKQGDGFIGGLTATVDIPHKWYNISFGMQLSESTIGILARPNLVSISEEFIDYKMFAAQVALLMHIKLIQNFVTIDLGPMLQYNSKLEFKDQTQDGYFVNNYENVTAKDITDISRFHLNGAVGASAGFSHFKLKAQYIYGFTNMLKKLNGVTSEESSFKGNQAMLVLGAMILF
jgi:hypothetical protein